MQFTTLITLTIATSMAAFSAMAAPTPACGTVCPALYQPICARSSDGLNKVFGNACELKNYNCKHPNANFVVVDSSACEDFVAVAAAPATAAAPICNTVCPAVYQPVCARAIDGLDKTFGNSCELKNYNCKFPNAKFTIVAEAACEDVNAPYCGKMCAMVDEPVCAKTKDGKTQTFSNACLLDVYKCEHPTENVELIANVACTVAEKRASAPVCPSACPEVYKPVCAKLQSGETKTFGNSCELNIFNCQNPSAKAEVIANAECPATPAPVCPSACPEVYKPVCAKLQSGETKTFGNSCELNVFNCQNPSAKAEVIANAECPATPAPVCPSACPEIYKPVCAKYPNGDLQTFGNSCEMKAFNCKNPNISFISVVDGDCDAN